MGTAGAQPGRRWGTGLGRLGSSLGMPGGAPGTGKVGLEEEESSRVLGWGREDGSMTATYSLFSSNNPPLNPNEGGCIYRLQT